MLNVYIYAKCGTCRNAIKFLAAHGVPHKTIPIRDRPPSKRDLLKMLSAYDGNVRRLFNTSGVDYRAMKLRDKLSDMVAKDAINLLAENGNLVKRPFVIGDDVALVGFDEDVWRDALL